MTIRVDQQHNKGALAYATEATKEIVLFGFEQLDLNRIWAMAISKNPAAAKLC